MSASASMSADDYGGVREASHSSKSQAAASSKRIREGSSRSGLSISEAQARDRYAGNAINRSEVDAKKKQLRDIEEEEKRAAQSAKSSFLPPVLLGNMKRYFWSRKAKIRASAAKAFGDPSLDPDHVSNKKKIKSLARPKAVSAQQRPSSNNSLPRISSSNGSSQASRQKSHIVDHTKDFDLSFSAAEDTAKRRNRPKQRLN